jgi:hypothetical protein
MDIFLTNSIRMPSDNPTIKKAYKDGTITKGQYDKLSDGLLLGIIKKKKGGGGKKKTGVKETRKKVGKEAHKKGRPKSGSYVKVDK